MGFPGGKVEPGETKEQALIREIREELDMKICVNSYFDMPKREQYAKLWKPLI